MTLHVKHSAAWREAVGVYVYSGGAWRTCTEVHVKDGGAWRKAYSSSYVFTATISVNANNYNVRTAAITAGWDGTSVLVATLTLAATLDSTSATTPAFQDGSLPAGSTIHLTVNNTRIIRGLGGNAGAGASGGVGDGAGSPGQKGGTAIYSRTPITIVNNGTIGGGGGGGGGGGAGSTFDAKSGITTWYAGGNGGAGKNGSTSGTNAGVAGAGGGAGTGGTGGTRGAAGLVGANGTGSTATTGGALGAAGSYIDGDSYATWTTAGTRYGTAVN